jgi:acyl-CoA reductase-like NAD-dependent aldehyde dehydrogenase
VGDPHDAETQIGPLVTSRQRDLVAAYVAIGKNQGARTVLGGDRPAQAHGWFVDPTIFTDVTPDMRIAQEEIFGPVLVAIPWRDRDEVIAMANDSTYGLNGAVFTADLDHGVEVATKMRTGAVEINGSPVGFQSPVGGFKSSGIGREGGHEGMNAYVELQSKGIPRNFAEALAATRT